MLICGIPMFFLEVSVGQYLGVGGMSVVGQLAPIFKVINPKIRHLVEQVRQILFAGCWILCAYDGVPGECVLHHCHHLDGLLHLPDLHGPPQPPLE